MKMAEVIITLRKLEELGEHVSISKDKGKWYIHGDKFDVISGSFLTAVNEAYSKWKEAKNDTTKV